MYFKNKLDKALAFYPDVPRCSESGHTYNRNFRKSNSLCDHYNYRGVEFRSMIENMNISWLAVLQDGHAPVPGAKPIIIIIIIDRLGLTNKPLLMSTNVNYIPVLHAMLALRNITLSNISIFFRTITIQ